MNFRIKYLIIIFAGLVLSNNVKAGNIDIWGVTKTIDTLEYKQVGPGIMYSRFKLPQYPLSVYMMTVDLNNPYNLIETFQAGEQLGKTEAMTTAFNRLNTVNHRPIGSVNGNFWVVSGQNQPTELLGFPYSGTMRNGEMITMPSTWNRGRAETAEGLLQEIGFAVIDENKKVWIDDMGFNGKVTIDGLGDYSISEINRIRKANQIVLYNGFLGAIATHSDDTGIEVFVTPKAGQSWGVGGDVECEVVSIIKDKGANSVPTGQTVLSGQGTGRTFLENLSVGQTVKVNMKISTLLDNTAVYAKQMVTGNALVMKNGELTVRNTNEAYNSQLYPRTGIGMSQDGKTLYLIVIDKMGGSIGANTTTMCGILKSCGAWNATSMDGGGSAQMMLDGAIVNKPADGKERAVANGWFVMHSAPDDNVVAKIEFEDLKIEVPYFASYNPSILAYNQYGVLINDSLSDFTLSCDASLGKIVDGKTFVSSANSVPGLLTAHYGNVSVSKLVNIIASDVTIKLDSVLIDSRREYPIDVNSSNGTTTMPIDPAALIWTVKDPEICSVTQGVLKGLKNGKTTIMGNLGTYNDSLKVTVEIPESGKILFDDFKTDNWILSASSALNAAITNSNLPVNWNTGLNIDFTYTSTRAPFLKLSRDIPFYSLPDTLKIGVNIGDIILSRVVLSLRANNSTSSTTKEFNSFQQNTDTYFTLPLEDVFNTSDIAIYPVRFEYLNFYLGAQTASQAYRLSLKDITLCYKGMDVTYYSPEKVSLFQVYPNPVKNELHVRFDGKYHPTQIKLYHLTGKLIQTFDCQEYVGNEVSLPMQKLAAGTYLLSIEQNGRLLESIKINKH
ncbi:MAG: phosphodiester glycosidase family protein [Paludibacteraceae bacterium]